MAMLNQNPIYDGGTTPPTNQNKVDSDVVTENVTLNEDGGATYSWSVGATTGGAFDYLYNLTTGYPNILKTLIDDSSGDNKVYSTNISLHNPYYVKRGFTTPEPDNKAGYSTATRVTKTDRMAMWNNSSTYSKQLGSKLDKLYSGRAVATVLPNCVGFVNGRSYEVWNLALESGYLQKQGDEYIIPSQGNKKVHTFQGVPSCNAYGFRLWSKYREGSAETTGYYISQSPVPGSIVCWKSPLGDGNPGHVGFVEAVYNPGSADEYCITSESGWCSLGVKNLVWTGKRTKANGYKYGNYPFMGFLCSPVCELASSGSQQVTISTVSEPTEEELEAIDEARDNFSGKTILADLEVNTKVEIQWFGNEKQNNRGKRINKLGAIAKIIDKNPDVECPYTLSFDGKTILGYYQRTAIKPVDKDNSVN